jgi:hydrogenase-4 component E
VQGHAALEPFLVAAGAVIVKGIVIPRLLYKAMRDTATHREIEPFIGFTPSLLLGALGAGVSVFFAQTLPLAPEHRATLLLPTSFATVLTGFLILTTRRKAITQVVGYLVLENGIFVMGLALLEAMPLFVEGGVLLDLFVGIFVMGIIVNHINREFSSMDTSRLSSLKE